MFSVLRQNQQPKDSVDAMLVAAVAQKLVKSKNDLGVAPKVMPILARASDVFCDIAIKALELASERDDPKAGAAVMQRACMYLFAKGVEGVMLWGNARYGEISIGFEPADMLSLRLSTDLPADQHELAVASREHGKMLFDAHYRFLLERMRQSSGDLGWDFVREETHKTLQWVPRIAVSFALMMGYDRHS
jgi:hypothetical protein